MQVDGIKPDHRENPRQKRRDFQFGGQKRRHDTRKRPGDGREQKRRYGTETGRKGRRSNRSSQGERPFHRQIGNVEHAERDVDPERHQGPQKPLRNGRDDEIDHIYFTQVTFLAMSSGTGSPNSFTTSSFKTTLNSV